MNKTWIFFKLRMLQLKSDKTALFFSYILPVLLLLGIGFPLQVRDGSVLNVSYVDSARTEQSARMLAALGARGYVTLTALPGGLAAAKPALSDNTLKHFLEIAPPREPGGQLEYRLYTNSLAENQVENAALRGLIDEYLDGRAAAGLRSTQVKTSKYTSYVVILLPGLIGMTLLIIGLNGFGAVLIEEEHSGLYKNIKTIDSSPIAFLAGLFISRLVVAYSVAAVMLAVGVLVFGIPWQINYLLLFVVITLGCIAFHGIGLAISAISPSVNAFNGIVNFAQIPLIVLGGVFFSTKAFPDWLQTVSNLTPLAQMNSAIHALLFDGVGLNDMGKLAPQIMVMAIWSIGSLLLARIKFRW